MTTWGVFRDNIRLAILRDNAVVGDPDWVATWSNPQLLVAYKFAVDKFTEHTAVRSQVQWSKDTVKTLTPSTVYYDMAVDKEFTLPNDVFESIEYSGRVRFERSSPPQVTYLDPLNTTGYVSATANQFGYRAFNDKLIVTSKMQTNDILYLEYFAYHSVPVADADVLSIPRWAESAVSYLTAAHALSSQSVVAAGNAEFKASPEKGDAMSNPWRHQQREFFMIYEKDIASRTRQDRLNAFRNEHGSGGF